MIYAEIVNNYWSFAKCSHINCTQDFQYFENRDGWFYLKANVPILHLIYGNRNTISHEEKYCKNCAEKLHSELKAFLNTKLWVFK